MRHLYVYISVKQISYWISISNHEALQLKSFALGMYTFFHKKYKIVYHIYVIASALNTLIMIIITINQNITRWKYFVHTRCDSNPWSVNASPMIYQLRYRPLVVCMNTKTCICYKSILIIIHNLNFRNFRIDATIYFKKIY